MFIAAMSTIAKTWKEPKCPSPDEWIKKMWYIFTMEYYMAMRGNDIWPFVGKWMDLEGVMLSEVSQAEKDRNHMFALIGLAGKQERPNGEPGGAEEGERVGEREGYKT